MGNSSSSSSSSRRESPPTASTMAQDSPYYQQCAADKTPVDLLALVVSYAPLYQNYMQRLYQSISERKYKFIAKVATTNGHKCVNAIQVKGLLNATGINKVMNELCKQGRFHDDIKIQFDLELKVQEQRADNGLRLVFLANELKYGPVVCEAHEKMYVRGLGVMGTTTVLVKLTMEDLDIQTVHLSGPFDDVVIFFRVYYDYLWQNAANANDASIRQQAGQEEECCICLEPLDVEEEELYHMRCGHCIHLACCRQLLERNPSSLCPMCRQGIHHPTPSQATIPSNAVAISRGPVTRRTSTHERTNSTNNTNNDSSRRSMRRRPQMTGALSNRLIGNNSDTIADEPPSTSTVRMEGRHESRAFPFTWPQATAGTRHDANRHDTGVVVDQCLAAILFFSTVLVLLVLEMKTPGGFLLCLLCVHMYNWLTDDYQYRPE